MEDHVRYQQVIDLVDSYQHCKDEAQLRAAFQLLDLNGDGLLSVEEWMAFSRAAEEEDQDEEHLALFRIADTNGDGSISEAEYIAMIITLTSTYSYGAEIPEDLLNAEEAAFRRTLREYRCSRSPALLDALFAQVDTEGKGFVSLHDLQQSPLVTRVPNKPLAVRRLLQTTNVQQSEHISKEQFAQLLLSL